MKSFHWLEEAVEVNTQPATIEELESRVEELESQVAEAEIVEQVTTVETIEEKQSIIEEAITAIKESGSISPELRRIMDITNVNSVLTHIHKNEYFTSLENYSRSNTTLLIALEEANQELDKKKKSLLESIAAKIKKMLKAFVEAFKSHDSIVNARYKALKSMSDEAYKEVCDNKTLKHVTPLSHIDALGDAISDALDVFTSDKPKKERYDQLRDTLKSCKSNMTTGTLKTLGLDSKKKAVEYFEKYFACRTKLANLYDEVDKASFWQQLIMDVISVATMGIGKIVASSVLYWIQRDMRAISELYLSTFKVVDVAGNL